MTLLCVLCREEDEKPTQALFVVGGLSLCGHHTRLAIESRRELRVQRDRVHSTGGRVTKR
jgi:hypothetical protein